MFVGPYVEARRCCDYSYHRNYHAHHHKYKVRDVPWSRFRLPTPSSRTPAPWSSSGGPVDLGEAELARELLLVQQRREVRHELLPDAPGRHACATYTGG